MRRALTIAAITFAILGASTTESRAQIFLTPFAGATFGNDAPDEQFSYGVSFVAMGAAAGVEIDFGYTPDFFDSTDAVIVVGDNNVTTFTGNLVIGVGGGPVRPYLVGGVGLIRSAIDSPDDLFDDVSTNDFGLDAGGGIIGMVSDRIGLRVDVRYFRTFTDPEPVDDDFDLALGPFDFWRATGGVSFRF